MFEEGWCHYVTVTDLTGRAVGSVMGMDCVKEMNNLSLTVLL